MTIWRRIWGWLPVKVEVTDDFAEWKGAQTCVRPFLWFNYPVVQIRPKYLERGDEGILLHELKHAEQDWRSLCFNTDDTLEREVEAYKVQLAWYAANPAWVQAGNPYTTPELVAHALATEYGFSTTEEHALELLRA